MPGSISDEASPEEFLPEIRATVALVALNGEKPVGELAEQFELQPDHTIQFRRHPVEAMAGPFAMDWTSKPFGPSVDLKVLQARIGKLTLGNDFFEGALTKAGMLSAKRGLTARIL